MAICQPNAVDSDAGDLLKELGALLKARERQCVARRSLVAGRRSRPASSRAEADRAIRIARSAEGLTRIGDAIRI